MVKKEVQRLPKELSVTILKSIDSEELTPYSSLLSNSRLVEAAGSVDSLTLELYRLIAQGLAKATMSRGEEDNDQITFTITDIGKSYVGMKDRALVTGTE